MTVLMMFYISIWSFKNLITRFASYRFLIQPDAFMYSKFVSFELIGVFKFFVTLIIWKHMLYLYNSYTVHSFKLMIVILALTILSRTALVQERFNSPWFNTQKSQFSTPFPFSKISFNRWIPFFGVFFQSV